MTDNIILIAFFSRPGQNYVRGSIINLPVGNTEVAAKKIQILTGGELFRITTHAYPDDYTRCTEVAKVELQGNERPVLTKMVDNMAGFDTILLGYPNWWGTMPMAVFSFLEQYDFSGKRIAPFCTHEGSGLGRSVKDISNLCPGAEVLSGCALPGHSVADADKTLHDWLHNVNILYQQRRTLCW